MDDIELDLRGLKCPLPVLRTRKVLSRLEPGAQLRVIATDPMAAIDIPHMCAEDGHMLISAERPDDRTLRFHISRGGDISAKPSGKS